MYLKYHVITVSNTHPGELVYLVDFDPCTRDRDLYLGHAFVLLDWVAEDDRLGIMSIKRTADSTQSGFLYVECRSLETGRIYLLEPHELANALEAYLLGYPVGL